MNQDVIPRGAGTFSRDLTKTKSLHCRDFTWALHMEKSISKLFPGTQGEVVANDWCIRLPTLHQPAQDIGTFTSEQLRLRQACTYLQYCQSFC